MASRPKYQIGREPRSDQEEVEHVEAISSEGLDPAAQTPVGGWLSPAETPIYVVDDEETTLHALVHFLREQGFDVRGFLDPMEAAEALRANNPHLLITDRNMPGLGGFDLARIALEEDPDIAVVILTGAREVELAIEAFRLGAVDYLLKPLDLEEIGATVGRTLFRPLRIPDLRLPVSLGVVPVVHPFGGISGHVH